MTKLILHVGAPKTGTSALQSAFARNVDNLRHAGFIYPEMSNSDMAKRGHVTSGNGVGLAKFLNPGIAYNGAEEPIERVLDEAVNSGANLLYSSEVMGSFRPAVMRTLNEMTVERGMQIQAVMYVRAPTDHAVSAYRQFVKHGYTESLEHYVKNDYKLPYGPILQRLKNSLPKEAIIVRNYDSCSKSLFQDFLKNILFINDHSSFEMPSKKVNRSLTGTEISVLRTLNKILDNSQSAAKIGRILVNNDPSSSYNLRASPLVIDIMQERYSADLDLTNEFLNGDILHMCKNVEILDNIDESLSEAETILAYLIGALFKQGIVNSPQRSPIVP